MNEETDNQPLPTESALPEQRVHRSRRRFPRKRYRDRGDRFRRGDSGDESPNSTSTNADPAGAATDVEAVDRQPREAAEGGAEGGEQVQA